MPLVLSGQSLTKSYGHRPLFTEISLDLVDGEHVGLIGPNGSGKSTLLKILAGLEMPDAGTRSLRKAARLGFVAQEDVFPAEASVLEVMLAACDDPQIEEHERVTRIGMTLGQVGFDRDDLQVAALSGGWRKRLAIARQLVTRPDVLLLDEPTNHLDLEGIVWLERLLTNAALAVLLVSHDRYFLENVASRVVELNRCYPKGYFGVSGSYSDFLAAREVFLAGQAQQQNVLANKVRREIEWLKRGPQARTTKSVARIKRADSLMGALAEVRFRNAQHRKVEIEFTATGRRANQLLAADDLGKSLGGKQLFSGLSFSLSPGTKVGLLGPNGSGKTTLLRILAGQIAPDEGTIERAAGLRTVWFDQNRQQLDKDQSLRSAIAFNEDHVMYRDRKIHVVAWARQFLFQPEQLDLPVGMLSGGEQARILIARLVLEPADVVLLDEPTNDLDIPSLEVLEESLSDFPGALVLVTHDRYLLDRIANVVLGLTGKRGARVYADFAQWEAAQEEEETSSVSSAGDATAPQAARQAQATKARGAVRDNSKRLTYQEQRELEQIESQIHAGEAALADCQKQVEDPDVVSNHVRLRAACEQLEAAQAEVDRLYARWEELERRK